MLRAPRARLGIGHRLAIRINQLQAARDILVSLEIALFRQNIDLEMRLLVLGHAEGRAIVVALIAEAQLIPQPRRYLAR